MPDRPNVLLLFTDQQRFDTVAAGGFGHMLTPNLDRLVREGTYYPNACTPNPVCVPARHNLLTGLPARYHGYGANDAHPLCASLPTLPRLLSDAGYDTRAVGKMHFRPTRRHSGFAKMELMEEIPNFREDDEYAMYLKEADWGRVQNIHGVRNLLYMTPQRSLIPEEHHGSTWVGERSAAYLRSNAGRRPFFLWSSWIAPHPPFDVPDTFADLYAGRDIPAALQTKTPLGPVAAYSGRYADGPPQDPACFRRMRELYYAAVSLVDKNVGKVLDALEEIGQLDDTLIVFTSDHGEMLGDHGCYQKMQPYDSCSRIPFIVRWPKGLPAGGRVEDFVDLNDILPTVLDAAGLEYPGPHSLPGSSLLREGGRDRAHQYVEFGNGPLRWVSMRDRRWKYNYFYGGGYEELFDMSADPAESENLLIARPGDGEVREHRERLKRRLVAHEERWGLKNLVFHGDFVKMESLRRSPYRNSQFPKFPGNIADPAERAAMNDFADEVIEAVKDEPTVKLHTLDLESWERNGAPKGAIEKIRRENL